MQGLTLQRSWFRQLRCRARLLPSVIWIEKAVNLLPDKHPSRHICQGHPGLHGQTRGQNFVKRITEAVPRGDRSPCKAEGEVRKTAWNVGQTVWCRTGPWTEGGVGSQLFHGALGSVSRGFLLGWTAMENPQDITYNWSFASSVFVVITCGGHVFGDTTLTSELHSLEIGEVFALEL